MALSVELILLGVFTLIFIGICVLTGILFIIKFFRLKSWPFLYMGIGLVGIALPWSGVAINFISVLLLNTVPPLELYFFFHGGMGAIFLFFWIMAILILSQMDRLKLKRLLVLLGIIAIITTIFYNIIIFTDTNILGSPVNEIQMDYALFSEIFLLTQQIIIFISGFWLSRTPLKSDDKHQKLKGKLMAVSFVLFAFASIIGVLIPVIFIIIIARILMVITIILLYAGLIFPKWVQWIFF